MNSWFFACLRLISIEPSTCGSKTIICCIDEQTMEKYIVSIAIKEISSEILLWIPNNPIPYRVILS